jgi:phosphopantetheinyl transferase (holo-ACP synthase)
VGRQLRGYPPELPVVEVLSDREQSIWQRWPVISPRRREWFWGRIVAKEAVAQCIALHGGRSRSLTAIEILPTPLGQPQVICAGLAPQSLPTVSISHVQTQVVAVAALPPEPIGIDIEPLGRVRGEDLKTLAFTTHDLACLSDPATDQTYLEMWVAKEAAAKAAGTGLQGRPADWRVLSYRQIEFPWCHRVDIGYRDRQFFTLVWAEGLTINAFCHPHVPRHLC